MFNRIISPERNDPFAEGDVKEKKSEEQQKVKESSTTSIASTISAPTTLLSSSSLSEKRRRWDMETPTVEDTKSSSKSYVPIRTPARKLMAIPTPMATDGFEEDRNQTYDLPAEIPEDMQHFGKLLDDKDESELSVEELKEGKIMRLLLKIKNGTPPMRKLLFDKLLIKQEILDEQQKVRRITALAIAALAEAAAPYGF
ncbi:hypothetical protein Glove_440g11 [Diversispora epigaea]|uniref:Splicing factor 3B subunit 1 domain-containing protein n=1 Tax=Diversispora epigaea TaxID=1348612 RepID=A0A397GVF2_9GLOM|nr:hypothetical protein Glove_440g11 [Diversispora epigaea]